MSIFNSPSLTVLLVACLVDRLGGTVTLAQEDIDTVAHRQLEETANEDHSITFTLLSTTEVH